MSNNMKKDIETKNTKNQLHGYQEWYTINGKIWVRAMYKNGNLIGYKERHIDKLKLTYYHIR